MSQQVEERRIQGGDPSRSEMDDVRGAISAGLELGGPPRMSVGAKERSAVRSEEAESFPARERENGGSVSREGR